MIFTSRSRRRINGTFSPVMRWARSVGAAAGHAWRRSLQLRVVASTLTLSFVVISVLGVVLTGQITDRLLDNPNDDLYLNPQAFSQAAAGTIGNAPRILPDTYSPWRNSTDMALNKDISLGGSRRATLRLEVINLFDNPWYAALASTAQGNANFGRVNAQANYSRTMQITGRFSF